MSDEARALVLTPRELAISKLMVELDKAIREHAGDYQVIDVMIACSNVAIAACKRKRVPPASIERAFRDLLAQAFQK